MRQILARDNLHVLEQFALSNVVLVFDYDGTLAPIVSDPEQALMRPRTRELLARLAERYPCAILSGRSRAEVMRFVAGAGVSWVLGNHGTEWGREPSDSVDFERKVRRWSARITERLQDFPGVVVENKRYSLAIHYRRSREKKQALAAIAVAVEGLSGAKIYPGKQVVNVVPEGAPHKGIALQRLRGTAGCDTALYVGDDTTDEDVFALDEPGQLLTIRVGRDRQSQAAYYLSKQSQIDALMQRLLTLRERKHARLIA
jgi:trehalose 6-phosphate phosphatase